MRNECIFEDTAPSVQDIHAMFVSCLRVVQLVYGMHAIGECAGAPTIHRTVAWHLPLVGHFVLNVDGSILSNPTRAGLGGFIRNFNIELVKAFYKRLDADDIILVEITALLLGINLCWERGIKEVTCVSD